MGKPLVAQKLQNIMYANWLAGRYQQNHHAAERN